MVEVKRKRVGSVVWNIYILNLCLYLPNGANRLWHSCTCLHTSRTCSYTCMVSILHNENGSVSVWGVRCKLHGTCREKSCVMWWQGLRSVVVCACTLHGTDPQVLLVRLLPPFSWVWTLICMPLLCADVACNRIVGVVQRSKYFWSTLAKFLRTNCQCWVAVWH